MKTTKDQSMVVFSKRTPMMLGLGVSSLIIPLLIVTGSIGKKTSIIKSPILTLDDGWRVVELAGMGIQFNVPLSLELNGANTYITIARKINSHPLLMKQGVYAIHSSGDILIIKVNVDIDFSAIRLKILDSGNLLIKEIDCYDNQVSTIILNIKGSKPRHYTSKL